MASLAAATSCVSIHELPLLLRADFGDVLLCMRLGATPFAEPVVRPLGHRLAANRAVASLDVQLP